MSFLVEKYKTESIDDFMFNRLLLQKLMFLATNQNIPHIIISGPSGSGKKTLVNFFLRALYGHSVNNVSKCKYNVGGSSTKKEVEIIQSNHHIVIEPTNTNHDRYILQGIIKQYAAHKTFSFIASDKNFKTIVIHNIENLAHNSQAALRRTMEKYANICRFVMICNNLSRILDPLKSRCAIYCVPLPSQKEIENILKNVLKKEKIDIEEDDLKDIVDKSDRSVKNALWMLDMKRYNIELPENNRFNLTPLIMLDKIYNDIIELLVKSMDDNLAGKITEEIYNANRANIYSILITNIDGSVIIVTLLDKLIKIINSEKNHSDESNDVNKSIQKDKICIEIVRAAAEFEYNLLHGRREIMHIDAFLAKVMMTFIENKELLSFLLPLPKKKILPKNTETKKNIRKNSKTNKVTPKKPISKSKTKTKSKK